MLRYLMLVALSLPGTPAPAAELMALQGGSIEVGSFHGVVFYTDEPDGYHVVATVAEGEAGLPVRFEATVVKNQRLLISVPGKLGGQSDVVEISRAGGRLVIASPPLPTERIVGRSPAD